MIAAITREAFTGTDLDTTVPLLTVSTAEAGAGVLTRNFFGYSDEHFADDFTYWRDVENTIGAELTMSLTSSYSDGLYDRIFTWPEGADALATSDRIITNFAALAAVPDETKSPTRWDFVGMWSYPSLPSAAAVALLDDIRSTIPLVDLTAENLGVNDEFPEGVQLQLQPRFRDGAMYAQAVVLIYQHEHSEVAWKNVITAGVLASSVPDLNFAYIEAESSFAVHTSACSETHSQSGHDRKLFDAVLASGAEFLPGAGPGLCVPEQ